MDLANFKKIVARVITQYFTQPNYYKLDGKPVFSVQHHPEASPGPQDSHYLFTRFTNMMREQKGQAAKRER